MLLFSNKPKCSGVQCERVEPWSWRVLVGCEIAEGDGEGGDLGGVSAAQLLPAGEGVPRGRRACEIFGTKEEDCRGAPLGVKREPVPRIIPITDA